jgi:hypothetical protein
VHRQVFKQHHAGAIECRDCAVCAGIKAKNHRRAVQGA